MKKRRLQIGFTVFLLAWVTLQLLLTLSLGRIAALVPAWIGRFTLVLLVAELVLELVQVSASYVREAKKRRFSILGRLKTQSSSNPSPESFGEVSVDVNHALQVALLFLLMAVVIYLLGILVAVPLYSFFYWKWRAGKDWRPSLLMAGTMLGGLYVVFIHLLQKPLYEGQLALWLEF